MTQKLVFIGAGNMADAIINGVINAGAMEPENIIASDTDKNRLLHMAQKHNVGIAQSNTEAAQQADILFLSVKPHIYDTVITEIKSYVKPTALIVTIAAGLGLESVKNKFGLAIKIIKTMPNTPAMVNCGITAVCPGENVTEAELAIVLKILNSVGKTEILPERLFDAFTAIAGSSPAYAFMFIEAMADAGVKHGLSRKQALEISTQALLGAAKLVQETGEHPSVLKDAVCSPGGTTIEAVCELERLGFRSAVISAVSVCAEKYKTLGG